MAPVFRVGIAGGGIGGLALARFLRLRSGGLVEATVFEREASARARRQGYYLGLLRSTVELLLHPLSIDAVEHDRIANAYAGFAVRDAQNRELVTMPAKGVFVDRCTLRDGLLEGVTMRWGASVQAYTEDADDVGLTLSDGTRERVDVLVACDGANSVLRRQRAPGLLYRDLGYTNVAGLLPLDTAPSGSGIRGLVGAGPVRWLGRFGHTLMILPYHKPNSGIEGAASGGSELCWVLSFPGHQEDWVGRYSDASDAVHDEYADSNAHRAALLAEAAGRVRSHFDFPSLADAVAATPAGPDLFGPRQIYSLDPAAILPSLDYDKQGQPLSGAKPSAVVLLGDAAHATTTHRGLGANTAILDASELADVLVKHAQAGSGSDPRKDLRLAMQAWEGAMLARGARIAAESTGSTRILHASGFFGDYVRPLLMRMVGVAVRFNMVPVDH